MAGTSNPTARPRNTFWALLLIAVLATGGLSTALKAHPNPAAGATVAVSGLHLAASLTLATRILLALDHARRTTRPPSCADASRPARTPAGFVESERPVQVIACRSVGLSITVTKPTVHRDVEPTDRRSSTTRNQSPCMPKQGTSVPG
jgi:hypothetical protein